MSKPQPLLIAPIDDANAITVRCALQQIGRDALHSPSAWHVQLPPDSVEIGPELGLRARGGLASRQISAVWNRRRRPVQAIPGSHPSDAAFLRDEWYLFHENIFALQTRLSPCLWVNSPAAARDCENKLHQLDCARRLGLKIPPTLVSNEPKAIRDFVKRHRRAVYKAFMPHAWKDSKSGKIFNVSVPILEPDMLTDDAALQLCPGIYQKFIDKRADLRVTIIGTQIFAMRIQRDDGAAFVDWRPRTRMADCIATPCALPQAMCDRLQALMSRLGIVYAAIDLVEDFDGDLHFLEVNQSGQFLFIEEWAPQWPLLGAFACMLAEGRTDYSMSDAARIRLSECRHQDLYLQWTQQHGRDHAAENWELSVD